MVEDHPINHEMIFQKIPDSGADELFCPTCGRRIRIIWSPEFQKTVIEAGDETAIHTASRGLKSLGCAEIFPAPGPDSAENRRMADWESFLTGMSFESLWKK